MTLEDDTSSVPPAERRGRGALSNASGRFEAARRVRVDDGWGAPDDAAPPLRTTVTRDASRTIITRCDNLAVVR